MEIVKENTTDTTAVIKVNVQPEDYREGVLATLKDYAKKANLPGFRPGKVPLSVVKNMFGKAVVLEELNKSITGKLNAFLKDNAIEIIGEPLPMPMDHIDLDPDANKSYELSYEVGLLPSLNLNLAPENFPTPLKVTVDQPFLEKELIQVKRRYGKMENPEVSEKEDLLFGVLSETEKESYPHGKKLSKMYLLNPMNIKSDVIKDMMGGKKAGDVLTFKASELFGTVVELKDTFEEHPENGDHFHLHHEAADQLLGEDFTFEVKRINRTIPAELNQQFYEKMYGEGVVNTEEEFREKLKGELETSFVRVSEMKFEKDIKKALLEGNNIPMSTEFLRKWLLATRNETVNATNVDEVLPMYVEAISWNLIVNQVLKENPSLQVTPEVLKETAKKEIKRNYGYGHSEEQLESLAESFLGDAEFREKMARAALDDIVYAQLKANSGKVEKEITASEFDLA